MISSLSKLIYIFDNRTRIQIILIFGIMILSAVLETAGVGLVLPFLKLLLDPTAFETDRRLHILYSFFGSKNSTDFIILICVCIVLFYLIKNIILLGLNYLQLRFMFSKRSSLGKKVFHSYLQLPYSFHLQHNTAELQRNIAFEVPKVFSFVQAGLKFCSEGSILICVIALLFWVNPTMIAFGVAIFGSISGVFFLFFRNHIKMLAKKVLDSQLAVGKAFLEGIGAIKEVKISGKEAFFPDRYYKSMMINARANWQNSTLGQTPRFLLEVAAVASFMATVIIFRDANSGLDQNLLPTLGVFAVGVLRIIPAFSQLVTQANILNFTAVGVDVVYAALRELEEENGRYKEVKNGTINFEKEIYIQNISYSFQKSEKEVLKDVSLTIPIGHSIGFVGPSGAGKSTLVNVIMGMLRAQRGNVLVDGNDIFDDIGCWHKIIGYIPQSIYLLDANIRENVAFGLEKKDIDDSRVQEAVEVAQFTEVVNQLPEGLETLVGENGVRLSGGQRQRLGIARALYHQPKILVLDEATSALDNETEKEVSRAIDRLSGYKTLIIIAHRLSTVKKCNCIYFMKNGMVVDSGSFEELISKNTEFKKMADIE